MDNQTVSLEVTVADRDFKVNCHQDEAESLKSAAELLNAEIDSMKGVSLETSAVIAALNFAAELLRARSSATEQLATIDDQVPDIQHLMNRIEAALQD